MTIGTITPTGPKAALRNHGLTPTERNLVDDTAEQAAESFYVHLGNELEKQTSAWVDRGVKRMLEDFPHSFDVTMTVTKDAEGRDLAEHPPRVAQALAEHLGNVLAQKGFDRFGSGASVTPQGVEMSVTVQFSNPMDI